MNRWIGNGERHGNWLRKSMLGKSRGWSLSRHRHCEHCGLDFEPRTAWDKHCSDQCIRDGEMQKPKPKPSCSKCGFVHNCPLDHCGICNHPLGSKENPMQLPQPGQPFQVPSTTGQSTGWVCPVCQQLIAFNTPHGHAYFTTDSNTGASTNFPGWPWGGRT